MLNYRESSNTSEFSFFTNNPRKNLNAGDFFFILVNFEMAKSSCGLYTETSFFHGILGPDFGCGLFSNADYIQPFN